MELNRRTDEPIKQTINLPNLKSREVGGEKTHRLQVPSLETAVLLARRLVDLTETAGLY